MPGANAGGHVAAKAQEVAALQAQAADAFELRTALDVSVRRLVLQMGSLQPTLIGQNALCHQTHVFLLFATTNIHCVSPVRTCNYHIMLLPSRDSFCAFSFACGVAFDLMMQISNSSLNCTLRRTHTAA